MSLPNDLTAVDTTTITDTFWNDLVENYESIFDGSAFDDGTVETKYGTVARYVRLHSGLTSQPVTLEVGQAYLAIILNSDPGDRAGEITQGGSPVIRSFSEQAAYMFTPGVGALTCATYNSGDWTGVDVRFLIIKLDNQAGEWANSASIPNPDLEFEDEEVLHATKVNKVIANVNSSKTLINVAGVEKLNVSNNTKTSMVPLGHLNQQEVTTPSSTPESKVVGEVEFTIPTNLEGCAILVSVSAEYLNGAGDYIPELVEIRDGSDTQMATEDFIYYNDPGGSTYSLPVNLLVTGLSAGTYTAELVYNLASTATYSTDTNYPGITNITVMAFGA